jgi:TetR/AcrR family transcriptional regulator, transcriptional repressor for nem operon
MARTKEFDPDVVLRAAMDLFWRKGYEATSMQDLVDHLGIGRGSIYATFGSKHELYLRALDRYTAESDGQVLAGLAEPGPALPAVRAFLEGFLTQALTDRRGCLVTNTAVECPDDGPSVKRVEASWEYLESAIAAALTRARDQGELSADKDPRALARFLVTFAQGLKVMSKVPDERRMRDAVAQALTLLS